MRIIVRVAAFVLGTIAFELAAPSLFPDDDGLGAGLLYFLVLVVAAGLWALWDGVRWDATAAVVACWALVGVAVGIEAPVSIYLNEGRDADVFWSDLAALTPFITGLVLVPALVGLGLGRLLRPKAAPAAG